jgi:hypothetical protein
MRRYKDKYFKDIYPNVILLVAEWDSIRQEAGEKPTNFTSIIGKTIYNLYLSNLVDDQRANVVVAVTKSLSHLDQYRDSKAPEKKHDQWRIDADSRRDIITGLQKKISNSSPPWEIVFIENGGGKERPTNSSFPFSPDGLLDYQNLYKAIRNIVERQGSDGSRDLFGTQALHALTDPKRSGSVGEAQVLLDKKDIDVHQ